MTLPQVRLKRNEDRRIRAGHLWVFSNEIDAQQTPLSGFEPGDAVEFVDSRGSVVGSGYVNPHSLICGRIVSRSAGRPPTADLILERLTRAVRLRDRLYPDGPFYRLAFGESDGLPGLVVDRFGDYLVVQITTAGMERRRDDILTALRQLTGADGIVLRNDTSTRALEGLPSYVETLGTVPDRTEITENGARFSVPLTGGQKTGWFYDHRENRRALARYVEGARVLDVFSYLGGWGVQAARAGASEVVCVDSSAAAVGEVEGNAALNGVGERVRGLKGDAAEVMERLRSDGERFDVVVLDPPAYIKRKKDIRKGEKGYLKINRLAMELLGRDAVLVSASCSYHMSRDALLGVLLRGSRELGRDLQILEEGHQAADHPVHPGIPETAYLKVFFGRME